MRPAATPRARTLRRGLAALAALMVLACVAGCGTGPGSTKPASTKPARSTTTTTGPATSTSDATYSAEPGAAAATVPVEQLAGELIMTKLVGTTPSAAELAAIRRLDIGGVILFGPNVTDAAQTKAFVHALDTARAPTASAAGLAPGVLVSVDQEGGAIRNVPFAPPDRTQPALASAGDAKAAEASGSATGAALAAVGISMDLGPVADLAEGPNRTMAGRAFGSEPAAVAPFVAASVRGLQRGGVAAVAKHFPGFGASSANSDEAVADVDLTRAQLLADDLAPFRAAIAAGTEVVMVSHGIYRGLGSKLPGTVEPKVATGLLRDELHFEGVAMTDSMNAKGFRDAWGDTVPRACPRAIAAGIDLLLLTGSMETAKLCRARILEAVRDGSLPEARVREAAARVEVLRAARAGASLR